MFKILQLIVLGAVVAVNPAWGDSGPAGLNEILDALRDRRQPIHSLSCEFRQQGTPTPYFVARAAQDMGVPPKKVEDKYLRRSTAKVVEVADGRYLLRLSHADEAGPADRVDLIGFDGRTHWQQSKVLNKDDPTGKTYRDAQTQLSRKDEASPFTAALSPIRMYLGDSVLNIQKGLLDQIREARTAERLNGSLPSRWEGRLAS